MIGYRLKRARQNMGLTQKALALELGITASAISQYESGKKIPRLDLFLQITDVLHTSPETILGRDASVIADDTDYTVRISKADLKILHEIKKHEHLYNLLISRPEELISLFDRKFK